MTWGFKHGYCDFCWGSTNGAKRQSSCGVAFIDPDTGFQNTIIINSSWGLGENIVKGTVTLMNGWYSSLHKKLESYLKKAL
jgi:phosphoenolpyruvate synthase/pyruvate phosphate dikinase